MREVQKYLHCKHSCDSQTDETCWKCKVKSEALCAVSGINRIDLYRELRAENVLVTTHCLYKAVENKDVDQELVKLIMRDLKLTGNYVPDNQDLQFCLGLTIAGSHAEILNILKDSGIHLTNQSLHSAVKHGDEELVSSILNELIKNKIWQPDDMYTDKALTEAHASGKTLCLSILKNAGAKLTNASVYWAIVDRDFTEVEYVINSLKESDTFDPESYEMAWSMAMAMENQDKRIYQLLKKEGVMPTSALVYALAEIGHDVNGILQVIEELKIYEKWDPEDLCISGAYMASCKRADQKLTDMLCKQGVDVNPAYLSIAVSLHQTNIQSVMNTLKENGRLDPTNRYIARAFAWSVAYRDKTIYDIFVSEGLYLTLPALVTAVTRMSTDTVEKVIDGLKKERRWHIEDDSALEALNGACIKEDKTAHDMLLSAGMRMKPRNLYVAIKYETVHGVKLIIREMRKLGLLGPSFEEVSDAVSLPRSFKDQNKFQLLKSEGICI